MSAKNTVHMRGQDGEENPAKRPRRSSQNMKITSVNDDCLIAIFSHLSMTDLAAVRKSCERFHYAADECFEKIISDDDDFNMNDNDYEKTALILNQFGRMIRNVQMSFEENDPKCKCKYFLLLKQCTALDALTIDNVDFDNLSIDPLEIEPLKNVSQLFLCSSSTLAFVRFLSAFDSLKLKTIFQPPQEIVVELLTFIAERMINLQYLYISIDSSTPLFVENLAKLQNLENLKELAISCEELLPMEMVIEPLVKLNSCRINLQNVRISNETLVMAISKLSKHDVHFRTATKIPESFVDQITCFKHNICNQIKPNGSYAHKFYHNYPDPAFDFDSDSDVESEM